MNPSYLTLGRGFVDVTNVLPSVRTVDKEEVIIHATGNPVDLTIFTPTAAVAQQIRNSAHWQFGTNATLQAAFQHALFTLRIPTTPHRPPPPTATARTPLTAPPNNEILAPTYGLRTIHPSALPPPLPMTSTTQPAAHPPPPPPPTTTPNTTTPNNTPTPNPPFLLPPQTHNSVPASQTLTATPSSNANPAQAPGPANPRPPSSATATPAAQPSHAAPAPAPPNHLSPTSTTTTPVASAQAAPAAEPAVAPSNAPAGAEPSVGQKRKRDGDGEGSGDGSDKVGSEREDDAGGASGADDPAPKKPKIGKEHLSLATYHITQIHALNSNIATEGAGEEDGA
ncbi:hypothetical protein HDV00_012483 [Rhizophlyctis rosea]|nr:hypothetical protein HDV00_012483 [Rhizophlyctis rosea]